MSDIQISASSKRCCGSTLQIKISSSSYDEKSPDGCNQKLIQFDDRARRIIVLICFLQLNMFKSDVFKPYKTCLFIQSAMLHFSKRKCFDIPNMETYLYDLSRRLSKFHLF